MSDTAHRLAPTPLADFGERLRSRRSINEFKPVRVSRDLLVDAIEVARWAPNHRLTEPWRFYLLGDETVDTLIDLIVELKTANKGETARAAIVKRLDGIPSWLLVTCRRSGDALREREDYAACCCAVQNLTSYLWQAGVGCKWTTGVVTREPRFYTLLNIDASSEFAVGLFHCGYPQRIPEQRRRAVDEILSELP